MIPHVTYDETRRVFSFTYGALNYVIGSLELRGMTVTDLYELDPEESDKHHHMLSLCEMGTMLRIANSPEKQGHPEPVNTCSHKLFRETITKPLKRKLEG